MRFKAAVLIGMLMLGAAVTSAAELTADEYQVKAALIYNLAKFVEWPERVLPEHHPHLTLCIVGQDPFGMNLDATVGGKPVQGKELLIRRVHNYITAQDCHMVFISSSEQNRLAQHLEALRKTSILTIGEMKQFATRGGMINLFIEDNRVQFEINIDVVERAGLKISSRVLNLARIVRSVEHE